MTKRAARLLFVTSFYPPATGGGSSRIYDFSRLLPQMGFDVSVLAFFPFPRLLEVRKIDKVDLMGVPTLGFKHPLDQIFSSLIGTLLVHILKDPEFTIASVPMGEPCIGASLVCSLFGRKLVVDVRDEWEDVVIKRTRHFLTRNLYNLYKKLFSAICRRSSFVITVTPTLVERMSHRGVRNVYMIPNGADTDLFHPIPKDEWLEIRKELRLGQDDFVIVYAGRMGWYYRIDTVIEALRVLVYEQKLRRMKFLVMGSGEIQKYLPLCRKAGLQDNVLFLGQKKRDEVARILPCCDLGVIPFDDDPIWISAYTTKIFEYCASGLPAIVTVAKGADLEKLVSENKIGFVTEPMKPRMLADAILEAYEDRDRLEKMRGNARKLAVQRFDRRKIAEEFAKRLEANLTA